MENTVDTKATETVGGSEPKTPTFDEVLTNKEYQSEFDKRVNKALETAKTKWEKEAKAKQTEAEKLAQMDADEKHRYELEQANNRAKDFESQLNAYKLREEAYKIAKSKGLDASLLDVIDFSKETAETISVKVSKLAEAYSKAVEEGIKKGNREKTPKTVSNTSSKSKKAYNRFSY